MTNTTTGHATESESSPRLTFTIPGRPTSWKRTNTFKGRRIDPRDQKALKQEIGWLAVRALPRGWDTRAKYALHVHAVYPNQASHGDCDNLAKLIADALEKVAYENDRQIWALHVTRTIGTPRTEVLFEILPEGN